MLPSAALSWTLTSITTARATEGRTRARVALSSSIANSPSMITGSSSRKTLQLRIGMSMWQAVSFVPPSSWLGPVEKSVLP